MGLNKSIGNMYKDVTHTFNTIKGACPHDCTFCYMKRWGNLKSVRLDEKEFRTDLGKGNFIFVGSSCDMFADVIPSEWIIKTLMYCEKYDNKYLFQSKNPKVFSDYGVNIAALNDFVLCTSLESNRYYKDIIKNAPSPEDRAFAMKDIPCKKYVTIEPIMDFDTNVLFDMILAINPIQVNVGADSGNNNLLEPGKEKLEILLYELGKITKVVQKKNLQRLLK